MSAGLWCRRDGRFVFADPREVSREVAGVDCDDGYRWRSLRSGPSSVWRVEWRSIALGRWFVVYVGTACECLDFYLEHAFGDDRWQMVF